MSHTTAQDARNTEFPNVELLRHAGWAVNSTNGRYCVAFRGPEEIVLVWQGGRWQQVAGRTAGRMAG